MPTWVRLVASSILVLPAWLLALPAAEAQWAVEKRSDETTVAFVQSTDAKRLSIYLSASSEVFAEFALEPGLSTLESEGCPTYQIDNSPPQLAADTDGKCEVSEQQARFRLGTVDGKQIESKALRKIMNGSKVRVIYRLRSLGYATATFSLRRSKQAVNRVLGSGVRVVGE